MAMVENEESEVYRIIRELNLSIDTISLTLKEWSFALQEQIGVFKLRSNAVISLDIQTEKILKNAMTFAETVDANEVGTEHVLFSILENDSNLVTELFSKSKGTLNAIKSKLRRIFNGESDNENDYYEDDSQGAEFTDDMEESYETNDKGNKKSKTKLIDQFGTDLTKQAKEGKLDPVVGRVDEIKRISQILARRKKNNPVLVGEPGVGKSAIVEGIAQLIVDGDVPDNLLGKKVITLDMGFVS